MIGTDPRHERFQHIRFIGGGSGAGKSTIARRLAETYRLQLYSTEQFSLLAQRTTPAGAPLLHDFMSMNMDERWLTRSPQEMFETFHAFHGEGFALLLEEMLALRADPPILAEGFNLLPHLIAPLLSRPGQAVWLIPTPEFRRAAFDSRGSTWDIPSRTSDPSRALANLLARDAIFAEELQSQASRLDLPLISVDINTSVDELTHRVAATLNVPPAPAEGADSTPAG